MSVKAKTWRRATCNGRWHKQGFTALTGTVGVISTCTGNVLDVDIMSWYGKACISNEKLKENEPAKYKQLKLLHGINHKAQYGTVNIFKRSSAGGKTIYPGYTQVHQFERIYPGYTQVHQFERIYPGYTQVHQFERIRHVHKMKGKSMRTLR